MAQLTFEDQQLTEPLPQRPFLFNNSTVSIRMIVVDTLWGLSIQTMFLFVIFLKLNQLGFASRSVLN